MDLRGRAALVTGGASGIGAAIAADLKAAGARVVVADRKGTEIVVDLSRPGEARRMVEEAVARLSGLDVLVKNAGGYTSPHVPKRNDDWRSQMELNLLSVMEAIKYALPSLAIRSGCVINVGSSSALGAEQYAGVEYAVAKAGLIRLTTALGKVDGVRVNCVCPHTVATDSVRHALRRDQSTRSRHLRRRSSVSTRSLLAAGG